MVGTRNSTLGLAFAAGAQYSMRLEATMMRGLLLLLAVAHAACATATPPVAPSTSSTVPAVAGAEERAPAALARGQALIARGEMAAAAVALREALALRPDLTDARLALGLALYGAGDLEGAVDELRATLEQDPAASAARATLAAALIARQDWGGARAALDELVRRHPDHAQAHYSLGLVRYAQRDLDGAAEAYRRVLALAPGHHDARYHLALVLKLAQREAEATPQFLAAAEAGVGRAQYFAGTAYAGGLGVERSLPLAIAWWTRAAEQGVAPALEALASLRQVALGRSRRPAVERDAAEQAFRDYRAGLWSELRDVARDGEESAGAALLRHGRVADALVILLREASALDDSAQQRLETLYEEGVAGALAPYDARILAWFHTAAAEGLTRARIALARAYGRGLGVPRDVPRAVALLRAVPHDDARRLLQELTP
jgi:TPR repeat protein